MKNPLIIIMTAAGMLLASMALNAQSRDTRTVNISESYNSIVLAGNHTLNFEIGSAGDPITVTGRADEIENIEIFVKDNTLHIKYKNGYKEKNPKGLEIYAKNPTLKSASVAGSGTIDISGKLDNGDNSFKVAGSGKIEIEKIDCRKMDISVAGSGSIKCPSVKASASNATVSGSGQIAINGTTGNLNSSIAGSGRITAKNLSADDLDVKISGSGNTIMDGRARNLKASIAGSGDLDAEGVSLRDANVKLSGSGNASFDCSGNLTATIAGSGKVYYSGNPTAVKVSGKSKNVVKR